MEKGDELFGRVVKRRMFLDMRNTAWENVSKRLEKESEEGNRQITMDMDEICSTEDDEEIQNVILWIKEHISKSGVSVNIGINEVEFKW